MKSKTYLLTEAALVVALTVVLSWLRLWNMPQGGSITLENVPLLVFALRHNIKWSLGAGAVAGLLQLIMGGYIATPVQAALDYPIAYASLALAALFAARPTAGVVVGSLARMACHVLSGVVFFASYAPAGQHPLVYSTIYNGTYMIPNMILTAVIVAVLLPRLKRLG